MRPAGNPRGFRPGAFVSLVKQETSSYAESAEVEDYGGLKHQCREQDRRLTQ